MYKGFNDLILTLNWSDPATNIVLVVAIFGMIPCALIFGRTILQLTSALLSGCLVHVVVDTLVKFIFSAVIIKAYVPIASFFQIIYVILQVLYWLKNAALKGRPDLLNHRLLRCNSVFRRLPVNSDDNGNCLSYSTQKHIE